MSQSYDTPDENVSDETKVPALPRIYEFYFNDGTKVTFTGFLGINDVYMALVDSGERLVFAARIDEIKYAMAVPEAPTSVTKN